ncbi:hypothetical protein FRC11_003715, partial [Ceratobasidium sp. 423]
MAQGQGYLQLLQLSTEVNQASELVGNNSCRLHVDTSEEEPMAPLSEEKLLVHHMADADAELLHWEQFEWAGEDSLGSIELVKFWRVHKHQFPPLYWVAMDVLPVQALAVSSECAFSS